VDSRKQRIFVALSLAGSFVPVRFQGALACFNVLVR
jgi:hypothetical protein